MDDNNLLAICNAHLNYNPDTGIITWVKMLSKFSNNLIGQETGCYSRGYKVMRINGINHLSHRIAFLIHYGYMPRSIDHINGVKDDNRALNLRECTLKENNRNCGMRSTNTTGYKGVSKSKNKNLTNDKWIAMIGTDDGPLYLGIFNSPREAALAYDEAAPKHHKKFCLTNKSMGLL